MKEKVSIEVAKERKLSRTNILEGFSEGWVLEA
jgi:hypothetical protein